MISCSVDCRTEEERDLKPLNENKFRISKSRYDSIDSYLSEQGGKYNDIPLTYDDEVYKQLLDNGIDKLLAQHIAHLFIRDTVSLFSEKVYQNDLEDTDHFEVIIAIVIDIADTSLGIDYRVYIKCKISEHSINQLANNAV